MTDTADQELAPPHTPDTEPIDITDEDWVNLRRSLLDVATIVCSGAGNETRADDTLAFAQRLEDWVTRPVPVIP